MNAANAGTHRRSRRRGRPWRVAAAVIGLIVVAWIVACAVTLLLADHRLQAGVGQAQVVRDGLTTTQLRSGADQTEVVAAAADFSDAHRLLTEGWMAPLRHVPVADRQLASATDLAQAAYTVTDAGRQALPDVRTLLSRPDRSPTAREAVIVQLARVVGAAHDKVAGVTLGPSRGLIPVLAGKRDLFARDLTKLQSGLTRADGASAALADLLTGSRTYLVFSANNAEMRSGSGMFLAAGTLTTHDGALVLGRFTPTSDLTLPDPSVPLSGDLATLWGHERPNQDFRNLALSPQFPANAALAARMWQARTGTHVDGVLAVDTAFLSAVLSATGPVTAGGVTVGSADVERYILHDQYAGVSGDQPGQAARHDRQGDLAAATFGALSSGHPDLSGLASDLDGAANGRHVLAWAATPATEADWQAAGVGGALGPDDVLLAVLNQGGNKLDPFMSVHATMNFRVAGADTDGTVAVTVMNGAPPNQPPYVAGDAGNPPAPDTYIGAVSLDIPGRSGRERVDGPMPLEAEGRDGPSFAMAAPIQLAAGRAVAMTFHFALAGTSGTLRIDPSARIGATSWTIGGRRFSDATAQTVAY